MKRNHNIFKTLYSYHMNNCPTDFKTQIFIIKNCEVLIIIIFIKVGYQTLIKNIQHLYKI